MVRGSTFKRPRTIERKSRVSTQDIRILRRETFAISLRTCTLIVPPVAISASARSALACWLEARYSMTLESRKLPGIGLVPIEFEAIRQATTESTQPFQEVCPRRLTRDMEPAPISHGNLDFVTFL